MRSLWRRLALQWLGGEGSEALTEDSAVLDMIFADQARAAPSFEVQRAAGVSHHAMMSPGGEQRSEHETASEEAARSRLPGRHPC
jgi:hypothetical protein